MSLNDYIREPKKDWTNDDWLQHAWIQRHNPWISDEDREYWKDKIQELQSGKRQVFRTEVEVKARDLINPFEEF